MSTDRHEDATSCADDVRCRVWSFLDARLASGPPSDSDDIFAAGYANSLFAMQLARFVQTEFEIELQADDMDIDHFRSVDSVVRLVSAKRRADHPDRRPQGPT